MANDQAETTAFRARECNLSGEWIVETEMMCINGLAAWVSVAGCGRPESCDEMTGYDPEVWAKRIASALEIEKTGFRPFNAQGNDNRVRVTVQRLVEAVSWVDEVYPATDRAGAAVVNVTWDQWNELRAALNLPRQPTPKDRKAWNKRSAENV